MMRIKAMDFVVAGSVLILGVSCGKKSPEAQSVEVAVPTPSLANEAVASDPTVPEQVAPERIAPSAEPVPAEAVVSVGAPPIGEVKEPVVAEPAPKRVAAQTAAQTPAKEEMSPEPAPTASPKDPEVSPAPQPQVTVESISGTKVVTVGKPFVMIGNIYTEGDGVADGFIWRFKSGDEVIERKTDEPKVEMTLGRPGEWAVTCGVLWNGRTISSMNIRIEARVVEDTPVLQDGMRPLKKNGVGMAAIMAEALVMLAYDAPASDGDVVSDAAPLMLASSAIVSQASDPSHEPAAADTSTDMPKDTLAAPIAIIPGSKIEIKDVSGAAHAIAGREFILNCDIGEYASGVTVYIWRIKNTDGEVFETRTNEPRVAVTLELVGDYVVTCYVVSGDETFATGQAFPITVVSGQTVISAGGPYKSMMGRSAKVLGNAKTAASKIVRYEWFFDSSDTPQWSASENAAVEHVFAHSGEFKAIYKVTLADGTSVSDTTVVNVGSLMPIAKAGNDIVSYPKRKVKLEGSGRSPDGKIVLYEWDFDGDGRYDWSSDKSGVVKRRFRWYEYPVLRVTDTEGNSATDTMRVVICPKNMTTVKGGKFCIDKLEWPNCRGAVPMVNVTLQEAAAACAKEDKRLCTADEWQRACRGDVAPANARPGLYPYGKEYSQTKCNTLDNPRGPNSLVKGSLFRGCVGDKVRAHDMSGNAAEWVATDDGTAAAMGGFYQSDAAGSNCDSRLTLENDTKYLYVGFRCCK